MRVLEARAALPDGVGHGLDRLVLADDPLVQVVFQVQQAMALGLGDLGEGDAGAAGHDLGDVVRRYLGCVGQGGLRGFQIGDRLGELVVQCRGIALRGLVALQPPHSLFQRDRVGWQGGLLAQADACACAVHQVDGLVRQESVGDVAGGELHGGDHGLVGDPYAVVYLVAGA